MGPYGPIVVSGLPRGAQMHKYVNDERTYMKLHEIKPSDRDVAIGWITQFQAEYRKKTAAVTGDPEYSVDPETIYYINGEVTVTTSLDLDFSHSHTHQTSQTVSIYGKRDYSKLKTHSREDLEYTEPDWGTVTHTVDIKVPDFDHQYQLGEFDPPFTFGVIASHFRITNCHKFNYSKLPESIHAPNAAAGWGDGIAFFECQNLDLGAVIERCSDTPGLFVAQCTLAKGSLTEFIQHIKKLKRFDCHSFYGMTPEQSLQLEAAFDAIRSGKIDEFDFQQQLTDIGLEEYL